VLVRWLMGLVCTLRGHDIKAIRASEDMEYGKCRRCGGFFYRLILQGGKRSEWWQYA